MTDIVITRLKATAEGIISEDFDIGPVAGPEFAQKAVSLAHQNGVKVLIHFGGDDNGENIRAAVQNHRAALVENLKNAIEKYGFDGIDINWENDVDWSLIPTFAEELRAALPGKILSYPGGVLYANDTVRPEIVDVVKHVDRFNLMSYMLGDWYTGEWFDSTHLSRLRNSTPRTPAAIEDSFKRYVDAGIPKNKLGMGIGFFACGYTNNITAPGQPSAGASVRGGDNAYPLSKLFGDTGAYDEKHLKWDNATGNSYLSFPAPAKPDSFGCRYVTFEDERSILEKGKFSRDNGYGGIIIWTINQGYVTSHANPHFLMHALRQGFIEPGFTPPVALSVYPGKTWVSPGSTRSFRYLLTGLTAPTSKNVQWKVLEDNGGTIDQNGVYTAPLNTSGTDTFHVVCTSTATPSCSGTATVTVSANAFWDPGMRIFNCAEWWLEISVSDPDTVGIDLLHNNEQKSLSPHGTNIFAISTQIKDGEKIRFLAFHKDGRTARSVEYTFKYGGTGLVPVEETAEPTVTSAPSPSTGPITTVTPSVDPTNVPSPILTSSPGGGGGGCNTAGVYTLLLPPAFLIFIRAHSGKNKCKK